MLTAETRDAQQQWQQAFARVRDLLRRIKVKNLSQLYQLSDVERQQLRTCFEEALPQIEEAEDRFLDVELRRARLRWQGMGMR